jgi:hypothetical protein
MGDDFWTMLWQVPLMILAVGLAFIVLVAILSMFD